ncbi:MAG: hypothetical protein M1357_03320 [Candidatus Marsarchaeota archaeon]|nr:hypothetical protein [Candidatus Marsarchaeota archaeon]
MSHGSDAESLEESRRRVSVRVRKLRSELGSLRKLYQFYKQNFDTVMSDDVCPVCGHSLTVDYKYTYAERAAAQMKALQLKMNEVSKAYDETLTRLSELESALAKKNKGGS